MVGQTEPPRLAAALEYEALGWSVLPLCPHNHVAVGKAHRGCQSPGKRPFFPNKAEGAQGEWKEFQTRRATPDEIRAQHAAQPVGYSQLLVAPGAGQPRVAQRQRHAVQRGRERAHQLPAAVGEQAKHRAQRQTTQRSHHRTPRPEAALQPGVRPVAGRPASVQRGRDAVPSR